MSDRYTGERFLPEECRGEIAVEHYQRYQFARQLAAGKKVLDAACGEGYGSSILAEVAAQVTGLDIDENAVARAEQKYGNEKLHYQKGSIEKLPFEDHSLDVVVSFETIEHVNEELQTRFLEEICRVLKEDGMLIMSTPNKAVYTDLVKGKNPFHVKEFYIEEYQTFLDRFFKKREMFCQYPSLGYFISKENGPDVVYHEKGKTQEESRYVIAVCSNTEQSFQIDTEKLVFFENQMYYDLNRYAHEKEQEILDMKREAEAFERQLENSIREQKRYIARLEDELRHPFKYLKKKILRR